MSHSSWSFEPLESGMAALTVGLPKDKRKRAEPAPGSKKARVEQAKKANVGKIFVVESFSSEFQVMESRFYEAVEYVERPPRLILRKLRIMSGVAGTVYHSRFNKEWLPMRPAAGVFVNIRKNEAGNDVQDGGVLVDDNNPEAGQVDASSEFPSQLKLADKGGEDWAVVSGYREYTVSKYRGTIHAYIKLDLGEGKFTIVSTKALDGYELREEEKKYEALTLGNVFVLSVEKKSPVVLRATVSGMEADKRYPVIWFYKVIEESTQQNPYATLKRLVVKDTKEWHLVPGFTSLESVTYDATKFQEGDFVDDVNVGKLFPKTLQVMHRSGTWYSFKNTENFLGQKLVPVKDNFFREENVPPFAETYVRFTDRGDWALMTLEDAKELYGDMQEAEERELKSQ